MKQNFNKLRRAYATNNWLRNHGYSSRRKLSSKRKERKNKQTPMTNIRYPLFDEYHMLPGIKKIINLKDLINNEENKEN